MYLRTWPAEDMARSGVGKKRVYCMRPWNLQDCSAESRNPRVKPCEFVFLLQGGVEV